MKSVFELKTDEQGIGRLYFDLPGETVNLFNEQVFDEFEKTLEHLETLKLKTLLLFSGKKDIFIAGADVYAFRKIDTPEAGWQAARRGQLLFERWHQLPFPTIVVINGACMGGGTELSLACTCRLASDHPKTRIGLPEVRLGILPGWGGTQRLPKLIGLPAALKMILSGKPVDARQGLKMGLVQKIISHQNLEQEALQFAQQMVQQNDLCWSKKLSVWERFPLTRQIILKQARKRVLKETHGFYPAPLKAIEVIDQTWNLPIEKGLEIEARALAELIVTPQSKNLVDLFIWSEEIKKEIRQAFDVSDLTPSEQLAFVGVRRRLHDLYLSLLKKNIKLLFMEENEELFQKIRQSVENELKKLVLRKKMNPEDQQKLLQNIHRGTELKDLDRHMLILVNELKVDQRQTLKDRMLLLNTFGLKDKITIDFIRNGAPVFNYFYWQKQNFTIEVSVTDNTNPEVVKNVLNSFLGIKLLPIISRKYPFGLVQWLLMIMSSEAVQLLKEGFSIGQIDQAMKAFGWQTGPFQLLKKLGAQPFSAVLKSMLQYDPQKEILGLFNVQQLLHWLEEEELKKAMNKRNDTETNEYIRQRINLLLANWAAQFLKEGAVRKEELNLLTVSALGFPPFHGGLIRWVAAQDAGQLSDRLQNFEKEAGFRYRLTEGLKELLAVKKTF